MERIRKRQAGEVAKLSFWGRYKNGLRRLTWLLARRISCLPMCPQANANITVSNPVAGPPATSGDGLADQAGPRNTAGSTSKYFDKA
jgi:hypothetical protein